MINVLSGYVFNIFTPSAATVKDQTVHPDDLWEGYDLYFKNVRSFKYFDRRKIKCNLLKREKHLKYMQNADLDVLILGRGLCAGRTLLESAARGALSGLFACGGDFGIDGHNLTLTIRNQHQLHHLGETSPFLMENDKIYSGYGSLSRALIEFIKKTVLHYTYALTASLIHGHKPYWLPSPQMRINAGQNYVSGKAFEVGQSVVSVNQAKLAIQYVLTSSMHSYIAGMRGSLIGNHMRIDSCQYDPLKKKYRLCVTDEQTKEKKILQSKAIIKCSDIVQEKSDSKKESDESLSFPKISQDPDGIYILSSDPRDIDSARRIIDKVIADNTQIKPVYNTSISENLRLMGSYTTKSFDGTEAYSGDFIAPYTALLRKKHNISQSEAEYLVKVYGSHSVFFPKNRKYNIKKYPFLESQIKYAISLEMACNLRDTFTRLCIPSQDVPALKLIVASILRKKLNWDYERYIQELRSI